MELGKKVCDLGENGCPAVWGSNMRKKFWAMCKTKVENLWLFISTNLILQAQQGWNEDPDSSRRDFRDTHPWGSPEGRYIWMVRVLIDQPLKSKGNLSLGL